MTEPRKRYSRGQLAQSTGVKGETIRYYENRGLLAPPGRSVGGHRLYTEDHLARLKFIRRARELGFSLGEISGLISLADAGNRSCDEVRETTASHLTDVREKIRDLRKMERTLKGLVRQCDNNSSPGCPIITALSS
jgi:MerR family transcriptional regulator, mercuric resistance operon regulatory protein